MRSLLHRRFRFIGLLATVGLLAGLPALGVSETNRPSNPVAYASSNRKREKLPAASPCRPASSPTSKRPLCQVAGYAKTVLVDKGDAVHAGALWPRSRCRNCWLIAAKTRGTRSSPTGVQAQRRGAEKGATSSCLFTVDHCQKQIRSCRRTSKHRDPPGFCEDHRPFSGIINQRMVDPARSSPRLRPEVPHKMPPSSHSSISPGSASRSLFPKWKFPSSERRSRSKSRSKIAQPQAGCGCDTLQSRAGPRDENYALRN
jgi:hypothetical protein